MENSRFFSIRNWTKFQHYHKRNPPWIRLYQTLLRERAYQKLSDTSRSHLVGLFLLASQHDNRIPDDQEWLRHELCTKTPIDLKTLTASGWIEYISQEASNMLASAEMLAPCEQLAPESRSETEADNSETEVQRQTVPVELLIYGRFKNVKLSEEEHVELLARFNGTLEGRIEALSEYIASKGKKYKSHYATILAWERKNGNGQQQQETRSERIARKNRESAALFDQREALRYGNGHRSASEPGKD